MPEYLNAKLRPVPPPPAPAPAEPGPAYAELDAVTNFPFLRGASHPDELGYRAIAGTDHDSLAGVVRMHEAAKRLASSCWSFAGSS